MHPNANLGQQSQSRFDRLEGRTTQSDGLRLSERVSTLRERLESRADEQAAGELRATVREARELVRGWSPDRAVSPDTAARYARTVEQMRVAGARPEDANCKASFEFRRAALVHETRGGLKTALRDLDRAKRGGDIDGAARAYNTLRDGLETLRSYPPSTGDREADRCRVSAFGGPSRPEYSNGKRSSLVSLPADWRDAVQRAAQPHDRPALAAMALSGCRPAEVRGIKVSQNDEEITLTIRGAKVDEDRGIKSRSLTFDKEALAETQVGQDLLNWLGGREVRTVAHQGSVASFRERVARAADRAGYDDVTAYTYRHAAARDLKDAGHDLATIADRLGHRAERSQYAYG